MSVTIPDPNFSGVRNTAGENSTSTDRALMSLSGICDAPFLLP